MALEPTIVLQAAEGDSEIVYEAKHWRALIDAVAVSEGVCGQDDFRVSVRAEGANQSVDISSGLSVVAGETSTAQGKYLQRNTGKVNFTDIPAPPSSGTKYYYLYLKINDKQTDAGVSTYTPAFVCGPDTAGVPANALWLAGILRRAGQASVLDGDIDDRRPRMQGQPNCEGHFEFYGGNGQPLPRQVLTRYRPLGGVRYLAGFTVGAGSIPSPNDAFAYIPWTGQWRASANLVSDVAGPATIQIRRTSTKLGQGLIQAPGAPSATTAPQTSTLAAVSGEMPFIKGDTVECFYMQNAVETSHLNGLGVDALRFSLTYVGPLPGLTG